MLATKLTSTGKDLKGLAKAAEVRSSGGCAFASSTPFKGGAAQPDGCCPLPPPARRSRPILLAAAALGLCRAGRCSSSSCCTRTCRLHHGCWHPQLLPSSPVQLAIESCRQVLLSKAPGIYETEEQAAEALVQVRASAPLLHHGGGRRAGRAGGRRARGGDEQLLLGHPGSSAASYTC